MLLPLKGTADGLGIILQILEEVSGHKGEFYRQLHRIEYQFARLAQNSSLYLSVGNRDLMTEKSLDLMAAMIKYFNSALLYYNQSFFGK